MASMTRKQASSRAAARRNPQPRPPVAPPTPIDVPTAVRGASSGFSVLLIGGLSAPLVGVLAPVAGTVWITLTAVVAFFVASRNIGVATRPMVHGALAAVLAYVLVLPLLLPFAEARNLQQIALTVLTAISVGAGTGWIQTRRPDRTA